MLNMQGRTLYGSFSFDRETFSDIIMYSKLFGFIL